MFRPLLPSARAEQEAWLGNLQRAAHLSPEEDARRKAWQAADVAIPWHAWAALAPQAPAPPPMPTHESHLLVLCGGSAGCIKCGAKPGFADDSCYCSSLFRPVESSGGQIRIPRTKLQHQDEKSSKSKHVLHMQNVSRSRFYLLRLTFYMCRTSNFSRGTLQEAPKRPPRGPQEAPKRLSSAPRTPKHLVI